jgi:hypothetical protein
MLMAIRTSEAEWRGNLREGEGRMKLGSAAFNLTVRLTR